MCVYVCTRVCVGVERWSRREKNGGTDLRWHGFTSLDLKKITVDFPDMLSFQHYANAAGFRKRLH